MSSHYVEDYLARQLKVKRRQVGRWELKALSAAYAAVGRLGIVNIPGRLEARLTVQLADVHTLELLERDCGSLHVGAARSLFDGSVMVTEIDIICLYGKETERLFKALLQTFTVRGPQKKKRKPKC